MRRLHECLVMGFVHVFLAYSRWKQVNFIWQLVLIFSRIIFVSCKRLPNRVLIRQYGCHWPPSVSWRLGSWRKSFWSWSCCIIVISCLCNCCIITNLLTSVIWPTTKYLSRLNKIRCGKIALVASNLWSSLLRGLVLSAWTRCINKNHLCLVELELSSFDFTAVFIHV